MNLFTSISIRCSVALFSIAWMVSGCSSSGDSATNNELLSADNSAVATVDDNSIPASGIPVVGNEIDDGAQENNDSVITGESPVEDSGESHTALTLGDSEPSIPDPLVQNFTQVEFNITVPSYQSNALQVRLSWGTIDFNASWVGDELWVASHDFPTNTPNELVVTFSDDNGGITLGQFETVFETGTNDSENFQISTTQFDTNRWDNDEDGESNIDELLVGADPLVNEDSLLEIRNSFTLHEQSRMSVSGSFESRVSEQRPFIDTYELNPDTDYPPTISLSGSVAIDETGNGTLNYYSIDRPNTLSLSGTRSTYENSVVWEASRSAYDGDYQHTVNVTNTVAVLDDTTRSYVEELTGRYSGTTTNTWETHSNLTGELIEGTSYCKPVAGTATLSYRTFPGSFEGSTIISKTIEDLYWRITIVRGENTTSEYFARKLILYAQAGNPQNANFLCDFVDF